MSGVVSEGYVLRSKYKHGDVLWGLRIYRDRKRKQCSFCGGRGWKQFEGADKESLCPQRDCRSGTISYEDVRDLYQVTGPLTVGSVEVIATVTKSDDDEGMWDNIIDPDNPGPIETEVEYMCFETGIGSGQIHSEERLFPDYQSAVAYAESVGAVSGGVERE